ncbi:MAG: thioredoxin family protein, partial [Bacteroidetes bacterium]|nr:thioredoxin family protein [Bacteroidota bacterium]
MPTFFDERRPHDGLTYADYLDQWTAAAEAPLDGLDKRERKLLYYTRYNLERSQQVHAAYEPSPALQAVVAT